MRFETKAIHAGQDPDPETGAVVVPIYQTSTYAQPSPGDHKGYEYSRTGNPTRKALETCLASLENAAHGLAFASGMAAVSAILSTLRSGDHVVSSDDVYGGTHRVFEQVFRAFGLDFTYVNTSDVDAVASAVTDRTRMIWVESPTNPLLKVTDIAAVARLARERGVLCAVDNTFMTPALQRPLDLGAHLVVHSTTKYLGGHSDVVGGFVGTNDAELNERLAFVQNSAGGIPGPFDSWLVLRGLKTLAVRMRAHEENAAGVVAFLSEHAAVAEVLHPSLPSHPGHEVQKRQARGFGGVISFRVKGGLEAARRVCSRTRYFLLAESLGGVESLIEHPGIMTHASIPLEDRRERGIGDDLVRISVGIESLEDLVEDLDLALAPE